MRERTNLSVKNIVVRIIFSLIILSFLFFISCENKPPTLSFEESNPVTFVIDHVDPYISFYSVWASSANEAWAGGMNGELYHFENGNWTKHESSVIGTIYDIWGRADDDIYAVCSSSEVLHYDGNSWSPLDFDNSISLLSIWGDPDGTIFVGGREGNSWNYKNDVWTKLPGNAPLDSWAIWGVTGEIHPVVEQNIKTVYVGGFKSWSVRYGNGAWEVNPYTSIWGIWGSSTQDVYLVGTLGRILHYNGERWRVQRSEWNYHLYGVHGNRAGNVYAVGYFGRIFHNDGTSWKKIESRTNLELRDVWVTADNTVFVVGSNSMVLRGTPTN